MSAVKGYDKLMRQLKEIENLDFVRASRAGAEVFLREMQSLTPVDTGDLLGSEHLEESGGAVNIVADSDHALPVEFGTYKMQSQPFMRPSIDNKQREAIAAVGADVEAQIKEKV